MKLLDAVVLFRGLFLTSPSAITYAADSCPALNPGHVNVTQLPSSWSDLCTAALLGPTLSSLRIWVSCLLQARFQTTMEQVHAAADNPAQRAQRHSRLGVQTQPLAGQTKHPVPNKGTWRKSKGRWAALKAACAKAALLFIQIRTLLNQSDRSLSENI